MSNPLIGNHIARLHALHRRDASIGRADRDGLHRSGLVGLNDIHECALCVSLDRRRRNQRCVLLRIHQKPRIHELARKERQILIRKNRLQFHGAGSRVHLVIQCQERTFGQLVLLRAVERIHRHLISHVQLFLNLRQIIFGDAENHGNWLQLRDHHQWRGASRGDDIPGIQQAQTYAAINRRFDRGIVHVRSGAGHSALIILYRALVLLNGLNLIVELLLGDRVSIECQLITVHINAGFSQQRFIVCQRSLGLQ